jgi:two-component system, response regulator
LTRHILLVEDNPDHAELVLRAFRKQRIANRVVVLSDGAAALASLLGDGRATEALPILLVLDLKLPLVDGLEVLERLREDPRTRTLPVVILTSSDEESDIAGGYEQGANSVVRKPVEFDAFNHAVGQLGLYWALVNQPPPLARPDQAPDR